MFILQSSQAFQISNLMTKKSADQTADNQIMIKRGVDS